MTDCVEPVYYIGVESSHYNRVGDIGVLVQNMSVPATPPSGNTNPAPATPHFTGKHWNLGNLSRAFNDGQCLRFSHSDGWNVLSR